MVAKQSLGSLVILVIAAACGGPEQQDGLARSAEVTAGQAEARARLTLPPPVSFREWGERPFYNHDHPDGFTFVIRSAADPTHFRAFGVDLRAHRVLFQIDGSITEELRTFQARLDANILNLQLVTVGDQRYVQGGGTELSGKPGGPPQPGPGGDEQRFASRLIQMGAEYHRTSTATLETLL